jgi:hypothetical protein
MQAQPLHFQIGLLDSSKPNLSNAQSESSSKIKMGGAFVKSTALGMYHPD